jgi:hypothetical protein
VATVLFQTAAQCPCDGFATHRQYVQCVRDAANMAVESAMLTKACKRVVMRGARRSTCGRSGGAVTCCQMTPTGMQRCQIKSVATRCLPPKAGSASVGSSESCWDACLPFPDGSLTDEAIDVAVGTALEGLSDPWGEDLALAVARVGAELGVRVEVVTAPTPTLMTAGASASTASARDCFNNFCPDVLYCGPRTSNEDLFGFLYPRVGDCLNGACFQHDLASFQRCVSPTPACYFSPQSFLTGVDAPFFSACATCPELDGGYLGGIDRITCSIARELANRDPLLRHPDCNCPACSRSFPGGTCESTGVCNASTGTCEQPTVCQTDLDCNPGATGVGLDADADCIWRTCRPSDAAADSTGCVTDVLVDESPGSLCDDGYSCTEGDACDNFGSCEGFQNHAACNSGAASNDPDADCIYNLCKVFGPRDSRGCVLGASHEGIGSPCLNLSCAPPSPCSGCTALGGCGCFADSNGDGVCP